MSVARVIGSLTEEELQEGIREEARIQTCENEFASIMEVIDTNAQKLTDSEYKTAMESLAHVRKTIHRHYKASEDYTYQLDELRNTYEASVQLIERQSVQLIERQHVLIDGLLDKFGESYVNLGKSYRTIVTSNMATDIATVIVVLLAIITIVHKLLA
jgi:hypothetical protein